MTRFVVLASAFAAALAVAYLNARALSWLVVLAAGSGFAGALAGRFCPRIAPPLILLLAYVTPALFVGTIGHNHYAFPVLWIAALLGVIAVSSGSGWSAPVTWRWALVSWALIVAVCWPIVAFRELDFDLARLAESRLPVAGSKIAGSGAVSWIAYTAMTTLTGLLWVDWLFRSYGSEGRQRFTREVVAPLAAGILLACGVGVYQALFDLSFLSGHAWPSIHRAAGTLMDANAFGMLAALWGPVFAAIGVASNRGRTLVLMLAAVLLTWLAVWTSGSRTAALVAGVGFLLALPGLIRAQTAPRARRLTLATIGAAAVLLAAVVSMVPSLTVSAVARGRHLLPDFSAASMKKSAGALWERDGYGTASVAMIREFPLVGVGIGSYNTLAHDFARESAGRSVPPDNAQNWYRQQLAELGMVGSIPWIAWVVVFLAALWPRRAAGARPGAALRGPLIAFGLASLLGIPAQDPAVTITFWLLVFWYAADTGAQPGTGRRMSPVAWTTMCLLVGGYAVARATPNDLRPPFRAARFGFPYTYGFYFDRPDQVWTGRHGVTVQPVPPSRRMRLTVWAAHPDANEHPLDVDVWVGHDHVIDRRLPRDLPVTEYVRIPRDAKRFVLEATVDRTFRPSASGSSSDHRDLGLAMKWEFVPEAPK